MTSKTWVAGTVIDSSWLQDVNDLTYNLPNNIVSSKGAGLIPINQTLTYSNQSSLGFMINKQRRWNPCGYPWLAKFDGTTDDTLVLIQCLTDIYTAGGGTMVCPPGIARVSSLVFDYATVVSVNIEGAGMGATYFQKIGATTTPVIDLTGHSGLTAFVNPSHYTGFQIISNASCVGMRTTNLAAVFLEEVWANSGTTGFRLDGTLVSSFNRCISSGNQTGVKTRKANAIYCNSLTFQDMTVAGNTTLGWDIGDAQDLNITGGNTENNGATGNTATGGMFVQSTVDDESGSSIISINTHHFEDNLGRALQTAAAGGLVLKLNGVQFLGTEAGRVMNIGAIQSCTLASVTAVGPGDVATIAATKSTIEDSNIATITDTSTYKIYKNVTNSAGSISFGSNFCGSSVLVAGSVAVVTGIKGTENIFLTCQIPAGTPGFLRISSKGPGGFTIVSSNGADTSTVGWFVVDSL